MNIKLTGAVAEKKKDLKTTIKTMKIPKTVKKVEKAQQPEGTVCVNIRTSSGSPIKSTISQEMKLKDALKDMMSGTEGKEDYWEVEEEEGGGFHFYVIIVFESFYE